MISAVLFIAFPSRAPFITDWCSLRFPSWSVRIVAVTRDLLQRFARAEPGAISELYREYGGSVFTVALSVLHDRDAAADAVQETFVKAHKAASSFDPDRRFAPWIYAIARRTAIDMARKRRPQTELGDHDVPVFTEDIEQTWERFEVRRAVDQLPEEERSVVKLTHLDGLTQSEAAEQLGLPIGTVKSRSSRAYRRLAEMLLHMRQE